MKSSFVCFSLLILFLFSSQLRAETEQKNKLQAAQNNKITNQITKIFIANKDDQVEIQFTSKNPPEYHAFTIPNPDRLVIDFKNSFLKADIQDISHPLFFSVRSSSDVKEDLRIVFDLKKSVSLIGENVSKNMEKYYLKINLAPHLAVQDNQGRETSGDNQSKTIYKLSTPEKSDTQNIAATSKSKIMPIIIIDAGHGGKDPGTIGKFARSKEKNVTLGYAKELKRQLDKSKKFQVFLTRDQDYFIPLNGRVNKARKVKADLFVSLHADSSPDGSTSGLSIYTLSEKSSDKQSELLAQKENKADIIGGADFSDASGDILKTLINLSQRSSMNESAKFAEIIIKSMKENNIETLQKTHRFAGFRVLTAPDVPSVLIELGYLSNKQEEKKLNSLSYKKRVSESLVKSAERYFSK